MSKISYFISNVRNFHKNEKLRLYTSRIIQVLIAALLIVLITPTKSSFKYEFQQGHYWKHDNLTSPFDFAIQKTDKELEEEKNEIVANHKLYFEYSEDASIKMQKDMEKNLRSVCEKQELSAQETDRVIDQATNILDKVIAHGIISNFKSENNQPNENLSIIIVKNNIAQEHEVGEYYTIKDIENIVNNVMKQNPANFSSIEYEFVADVITKNISPNIIFDKKKTDDILASQIEDISLTKGLISKNDKIISKGELITQEKYQILTSFRNEYEGNEAGSNRHIADVGQYLLVIISLVAMVLFIYNADKSIFSNNRKMLMIFTVIFLMVAMTMGTLYIEQKYLYIVPLCLSPILIRTFFDTKVSLYVFLVSIIIIGFSVPNSFEFVFYQLIAGMVAILSVERLEKRSEFFSTALLVFLTYSAIYVAMTLIQDANLKQLDIYRFIYFAINAIMLLFAFPIVFLLEKIFGLVSEMSLMEYSNTTSKVLRELSMKAPGTFQHCIQVANIAEDIIHKIGGNALLVRAGALHHDIGKMMAPMYFTENQNSGINPLNELSNEDAAQIIIAHVQNGINIGHKHKLPEPILDFIRTHHGNSKTKYFYYKEINENPGMEVDGEKFSYKSRRPYSRETAVVMMADAIEAASRSMKEYTKKSINDLVENIIDGQIKDNQFSESDITFSDIAEIKKQLKVNIENIYHARIAYPSMQEGNK